MLRYDTAIVLRADRRDHKALGLLATGLFEIVGRADAALSNLRFCVHAHGNTTKASDCRKLMEKISAVAELESNATKAKSANDLAAAMASFIELVGCLGCVFTDLSVA